MTFRCEFGLAKNIKFCYFGVRVWILLVSKGVPQGCVFGHIEFFAFHVS